jgi:hypothetical protein
MENTIDAGRKVYWKLLSKMKFTFGVWVAIVAYQYIAGLFSLLIGYGVVMIGCAIWNTVSLVNISRNIKYFSKTPVGLYNYYERQDNILIYVLINLFLGGVLGVIGCLMTYADRNYAMKNGNALLALEDIVMDQG